MAKICSASEEIISLLSSVLLKGEIVAVPTETVYGLAAHAYNDAACAKVFQAKLRPTFDPLIVHLPLGFPLDEVAAPNPLVDILAEAFWPGPLTLVLAKKPSIPDIVTAGLDSVAVRVPRHPVFQKLLQACQTPLAAPSANPFGYVSPTTAEHVQRSLGDRIPYILDGGPCEIGLESTILDIRNPSRPTLLRPGAISREQLSALLQIPVTDPGSPRTGQTMPGQLKKHYSPHSRCRLVEAIDPEEPARHPVTAYLFYQKPTRPVTANTFWLSDDGNEIKAARHLFTVLRDIDEASFSQLVAEKAPPHGLGSAINDRLTRAAAEDD